MSVPAGDRPDLRADCGSCSGLCCMVPAFAASADFAITKPAGRACPHLRADFRCGIHAGLRQHGFGGCAAYDCFGAGQKVSQVILGGRDWRRDRRAAERAVAVFPVVRQLHELLWYLSEAVTLAPAGPLHGELARALDETERLTRRRPQALLELDLAAHGRAVDALLRRASELVRADPAGADPAGAGRAAAGLAGADLAGADLAGADLAGADLAGADLAGADLAGARIAGADLIGAGLAGADLRGADLRGAYLIGADLTGADLRLADLIGADLRGAELAGADLTGSIFLTQPQLAAARGDSATRVPAPLARPAHWSPVPLPRPAAARRGR